MPKQNVEQRELEIGLTAGMWRAVRHAVEAAQGCSEPKFLKAVPGALAKIDAALRGSQSLGAAGPNLYVKSTVGGWITLAEIVLTFGTTDCKAAGRTMVVACSQVINARRGKEETAA